MKVLLLGVDINRSSCDPKMYYQKCDFEYDEALYLDETAQRIAAFTDDIREECDAVAWTLQNVLISADLEPKPLSAEECAFHHVVPFENEDKFLPKAQMSPYPEHQDYFEQLKEDGIDTVVLTGFYSSKCIYWTLRSLLDNEFKVIVPTDLIADMVNTHPMNAFDDFMNEVYHGQVIFTDSENVADMLLTQEDLRKPPVAKFTWEDINAMHYGPGS